MEPAVTTIHTQLSEVSPQSFPLALTMGWPSLDKIKLGQLPIGLDKHATIIYKHQGTGINPRGWGTWHWGPKGPNPNMSQRHYYPISIPGLPVQILEWEGEGVGAAQGQIGMLWFQNQ